MTQEVHFDLPKQSTPLEAANTHRPIGRSVEAVHAGQWSPTPMDLTGTPCDVAGRDTAGVQYWI